MNNSQKLSFLCIGSSSQDVYLYNVDDLAPVCVGPDNCFYNIHLGDKIYVNKAKFMTGGGASNASVTFSRGGQKSYFMGLIGCDQAGSSCIAAFAKDKVDTKYVTFSQKHNTDYSTLLLAPNGERSILTYRGCGRHLKPEYFNLDKVTDHIDWIYLTSLVGHYDILEPLLIQAKARGIKVAFNPGKAELRKPNKLKALLPYITILSVNKQEAQMIVDGDSSEELLRKLRSYCPVVIITDGVNGSVAADEHEAIRAGLYEPDTPSVDRTGAGDSFCSGFTLSYALGDGLKQAMLYGSANSASVVSKIGSKPGILHRSRVKSFEPMEMQNFEL